MNPLIIYIIKSAVYLSGFYVVYRLFLSRDTMYGRNRAFIILSVISAMILPLITIQTNRLLIFPVFGKVLSEILVSGNNNGNMYPGSGSGTLPVYRWIYIIYISGVVLFVGKLAVDLLELAFLINRQKKSGSNLIRFNGLNTSGYSAFGHIFISEKLSGSEAAEIIRHEQNHLDHNHSSDIIFIEIVRAIQWFNPAIHLFGRSLREVHEYQADKECISLGTNVNRYQKLLLNQVFKSKVFTITNSFSNPSLIKRRMIMMTKKQSKSLSNLKLIFILPVIGAVMMAFSSYNDQATSLQSLPEVMAPPPPPPPPAEGKTGNSLVQVKDETTLETYGTETEPFVVVEEMPAFPGGESEMLSYLGENINYPQNAKEMNIQGKVIIRFCVNASGGVERASVLKGVVPDLDQEALRVVNTLPKFKPGRQGGKEVPVWFMVPINFTLK
jgi:TonB family protein